MSNILKHALDAIKGQKFSVILATTQATLALSSALYHIVSNRGIQEQSVVLLGFAMFFGACAFIFRKKKSYTNNYRYKNLSVVGILLKRQSQIQNTSFNILGMSFILCVLSGIVTKHEIDISILLFAFVLYVMLYIRLTILEWRIRSGTYGTNEDDAREIISFVLRNQSLMGGDDGKGRPIITTADMREMAEAAVSDLTRPEVAY